jgi:hypothetical protein
MYEYMRTGSVKTYRLQQAEMIKVNDYRKQGVTCLLLQEMPKQNWLKRSEV